MSAGPAHVASDDQPPMVLPRVVVRVFEPLDTREGLARGGDNATGGWCMVMLDDDGGSAHTSQLGSWPAVRAVPIGELGTVLAMIAEQAGTPVRVNIREADGTVHTDILNPPDTDGDPMPAHEADSLVTTRRTGAVAVGFLPGEPILIAFVVHIATADNNGRLQLPLGPAPTVVPKDARWILVGGTSKTVASRPNRT